MTGAINFKWWRCRDGYRYDPRRGGSLTSASERFEQYDPLSVSALFARFAETPATPAGINDFCNHFGLLGGNRPDLVTSAWRQESPKSEAVSLDEILHHQARLRLALRRFESGDYSKLSEYWYSNITALLRVELQIDEQGKLAWTMSPQDLIRALWLQFAQHVSSGTQLLRCERCNAPFIVGTGTGRRSTSMFCSSTCKVAAFRARAAG